MRRSERGGASLSVEVLMWAPIALVIIGFVVGIGRMSMAQDAVSGAAGAAARAASLERDGQSAQSAAQQAASANLSSGGLTCAPSVSVDTSVFARPAGQAGTVHATVTCVTSLGLGFGSRTVHATGSAPVDTYRERRG